jgi:ectoine hydroxylase-related dioxygenase (phytanoyl-CoA dioxygenase family)
MGLICFAKEAEDVMIWNFRRLTNPNLISSLILPKRRWMAVVKQILGDDVVLIHKGVFLSNPGAEAQEYHQDGPHLTTQYQRPCHAINVFIPLIDLTIRNGPTEFVAGSHILNYDVFNRHNVVTPLVSAGTPIIFDYRLGHRGLANTSDVCRPIVYCTYAAAGNGKEFRDSVNFSRKRYHRLGDLIDKPLSREQRRKMRQGSTQEQAVLKATVELHNL